MKKYLDIFKCLLCVFLMAGCGQTERETLDLLADVFIHEFIINENKGVINNEKMEINVILPPKTDVSALSPIITVADNATVSPASGSPQNFSNPVEYRVVNGNVYNIYKVSVEVLNARITRFVLDGKYNGVIDQQTNTIVVTVPTSVDITNLTPTIEYTQGAVISPEENESQDFTRPVTYTLIYMDEIFSYEVSVVQSDYAYAFIGTAESVDALSNADEKSAAKWLLNNIPNSKYVSMQSLQAGTVTLDAYTAIWIHYEQAMSLPTLMSNKNVTDAVKQYYNNGGNVFLSGVACLYAGSIGIVPSTYTPNNPFGSFGDADQVNAPGETWGIAITGCKDHPIYKDLDIDETTQNWPVVWFIGKEISWRRNIGCPWDLVSPYQQDWSDWMAKTGGIPLASFNWDNDCNEKVAISAFGGKDGKGKAVLVGAPSYDWYYEKEDFSVNSYHTNIEKITTNIFNYLTGNQE